MRKILILFDLQEQLKKINAGEFPENPFVAPYGNAPAALCALEINKTKTLRITGNSGAKSKPGFRINTPAISDLNSGDRITITGRLGEGVPKSDWAIVIDRFIDKDNYAGLSQHVSPAQGELFSMTYVLDEEDLKFPLLVRSNHWGKSVEPMIFFVDSILVSRETSDTMFVKDSRGLIYSLANDENVQTLKPGDVTKFLRSAGTPKYKIFEHDGKKAIKISRRINNWDGIDISLTGMNLKQGNRYTISAHGIVDGIAPKNARMMFQLLPEFIWRSELYAQDEKEFSLRHTLSATELQSTDFIRIATCDDGAKMSFSIFSVEITVNT